MESQCYLSRWNFIEEYVTDKTVLDIGPAELTGTINYTKLDHAIWPKINAVARKAIGLEINMEQVTAIRELGYDIRHGDAEDFNLGMKFDIIFTGELIEHLSNPGLFLECARKHMRPDSTLILTTPNRFSAVEFLSSFIHDRIPTYNKPISKHVNFYDEKCLSDLLYRHGYSILSLNYYIWVGVPSKNWKIQLINVYLRKYRRRFLPGLIVAAKLEN
jgi:SAM-dependent methyltransferase